MAIQSKGSWCFPAGGLTVENFAKLWKASELWISDAGNFMQ
ncbi:MAG TPA: hypothetical protein VKR52_13135 [Terracidiphilus sp.]|nr:hypothetical protein [Terracidiphilus sp.]